jgi:hypothetical protein
MEQFYLEYLVFEQSTKVDTFHTELALYYLNSLRTLLGSGNFAGVSTHSPGTEKGAVGTLRSKLLILLKQSTLYNAFEVLQYIITSASKTQGTSATSPVARADRIDTYLFDELVILYTRVQNLLSILFLLFTLFSFIFDFRFDLIISHDDQIGEYTKAIDILVFDLQAYSRAEEYCLEHDRASQLTSLSVLHDNTLSDSSSLATTTSFSMLSTSPSHPEDDNNASKFGGSLQRPSSSSPSQSTLLLSKKERISSPKPKNLLVYLLTLYIQMQPTDNMECVFFLPFPLVALYNIVS